MKTSLATSVAVALVAALGACTPSSGAPSSSNAQDNSPRGGTAGGSSSEPADSGAGATVADAGAEMGTDAADAALSSAVVDAAPAVTVVGLRAVNVRAGARLPRTSNPRHGSTAWTVMIVAASGPAPELQTVFAQLNGLRLTGALGEVTCSPIASGEYPESVPHGSGAMAVTLNFASERDARAFAAALAEPPLWIGRARVLCAD